MTEQEIMDLKTTIDAIADEVNAIVDNAKTIPAEKIERLLLIKNRLRHLVRTL